MKTWMRALLLLTPILLSCASDDGVIVVNIPPEITWTFNPIAVGKNMNVVLTVSITDPDVDDTHTTTWSVTRGTLTPQGTSGTQMLWDVPNALGTDQVVVTVSDGTDTDKVEADIIVGTGSTSPSLSQNLLLSDSPYVLQPTNGSATVPPASNITVEAGVIVYFGSAGGSIQVEGSMTANGTAASPVVFRANDRTINCGTGPGWWTGIQVRSTGLVNLTHTEVWYADKGLHLVDSGRARLTACELRCGNIGAQISSAGWLVVDSCEVDNNTDVGVRVSSLSLLPDSVAIRDSNISINHISGIELDLRNGQAVRIVIERNRIEANFTNGIGLANQVVPVIRLNHFEANGLSGGLTNLRLRPGYPGDQPTGGISPGLPWFDAASNYWGGAFTDSTNIKATIRDRDDDTSIGTTVYVTPWLDTSPLP